MKKTIIALALAAGLTSFAGNAKASPASPLTWNWIETGSDLGDGSGTFSVNDNYKRSRGGFLVTSFTGTIGGSAVSLMFPNQKYYMAFDDNFLGGFDPYSINANSVPTGSDVQLAIENQADTFNFSPGNGVYSFFDAISGGHNGSLSFSPAVPEPSTYALFGLGALALVVAYRRKVA
jgi:PEP-CTERM motif